mmetsp:Transcript_36340/g.102661  ORF Transcript_36340/g.102661 Transcript_36340/m.102661 type:complete len:331 (+) Transcript_36340:83-1075(+)
MFNLTAKPSAYSSAQAPRREEAVSLTSKPCVVAIPARQVQAPRAGSRRASFLVQASCASQQGPAAQPRICTLYEGSSPYNPNIQILECPLVGVPPEVAGARMLILDFSGNPHSLYRQNDVVTGQYWDELALVAAVAPPGPLAILGMGAGTVARIAHSISPQRVIHGWELDSTVVDVARQFLGLQELEDSGHVVIHVGDALSGDVTMDGGFAGIVVDIFVNGSLHNDLLQVDTWRRFADSLAPGGRIIANLGSPPFPGTEHYPAVQKSQQALEAMAGAFGGNVCYKYQMTNVGGSAIGMSGPLPLPVHCQSLPPRLRDCGNGWKHFSSMPQ